MLLLIEVIMFKEFFDNPILFFPILGFLWVPFLIKLAIMVALSYAVAALSKPKAPKAQAPKPAGLENFNIPTADEGRPIQVLFGKRRISGPNVVWYGDLKVTPIVEKVKK